MIIIIIASPPLACIHEYFFSRLGTVYLYLRYHAKEINSVTQYFKSCPPTSSLGCHVSFLVWKSAVAQNKPEIVPGRRNGNEALVRPGRN